MRNKMKYIVKIQFYTPDMYPSAIGSFTIEAENKKKAAKIQVDLLKKAGYLEREIEVIKIDKC